MTNDEISEVLGRVANELERRRADNDCRDKVSVDVLERYIRHTLTSEDSSQLRDHLIQCLSCLNAYAELYGMLSGLTPADALEVKRRQQSIPMTESAVHAIEGMLKRLRAIFDELQINEPRLTPALLPGVSGAVAGSSLSGLASLQVITQAWKRVRRRKPVNRHTALLTELKELAAQHTQVVRVLERGDLPVGEKRALRRRSKVVSGKLVMLIMAARQAGLVPDSDLRALDLSDK